MPRIILSTIAALCAAALGACATSPTVWTYAPENNHPGRIYYYERSNTDGSLDERVTVFHRDAETVEVYKENGLCRRAAFVSSHMDWETFSADKITGGQLTPQGGHMDFAFLTWDKDASQLNVYVKFQEGEIREEAPIEMTPWHLYDYDFASLTLATQHLASKTADFSFGMALVWTDPEIEDPLVWMGDVKARYAGHETHLGAQTRRYTLSGSALSGKRKTDGEAVIWLDAIDGHIVDARLPVPNHAGYKDLRLKLLKTSDGGAREWRALLKSHFEGC